MAVPKPIPSPTLVAQLPLTLEWQGMAGNNNQIKPIQQEHCITHNWKQRNAWLGPPIRLMGLPSRITSDNMQQVSKRRKCCGSAVLCRRGISWFCGCDQGSPTDNISGAVGNQKPHRTTNGVSPSQPASLPAPTPGKTRGATRFART